MLRWWEEISTGISRMSQFPENLPILLLLISPPISSPLKRCGAAGQEGDLWPGSTLGTCHHCVCSHSSIQRWQLQCPMWDADGCWLQGQVFGVSLACEDAEVGGLSAMTFPIAGEELNRAPTTLTLHVHVLLPPSPVNTKARGITQPVSASSLLPGLTPPPSSPIFLPALPKYPRLSHNLVPSQRCCWARILPRTATAVLFPLWQLYGNGSDMCQQ